MSNFILKYLPQLIIFGLLLSSNEAHASGGPMDPVPQIVNFLILVGLFTVLYQMKIRKTLVERAEKIKTELEKGQKEWSIAQAHAEEVNKDYQELDAKISAIHQQTQEEIAAMTAHFKEQMSAEEVRIANATQRSIQDELARAKRDLQEESVMIAMDIAESLVKTSIGAEDHSRFKQTFIHAVEKEGTNV
jgi:F0F1-type ATP synthase membrane subunit b/b'